MFLKKLGALLTISAVLALTPSMASAQTYVSPGETPTGGSNDTGGQSTEVGGTQFTDGGATGDTGGLGTEVQGTQFTNDGAVSPQADVAGTQSGRSGLAFTGIGLTVLVAGLLLVGFGSLARRAGRRQGIEVAA